MKNLTEHQQLINTLADKIGIYNGYYENNGNYKETSSLTKEKFLNAMGYKTSTKEEITSYLNDMHEEGMKPLKISNILSRIENGNGFILPIRTQKLTAGKIHLSIQLENGQTQQYTKSITHDDIRNNDFNMELDNIIDGYHEITLTNNDSDYKQQSYLILCPAQAFLKDWIKNDEKRWGVSVQLYALQSQENHGIGTFTDLTNFGINLAKQGGSMIELNPIHAQLTEINSSAKSPYFPISRYNINPLYMDLTKMTGYDKCESIKKIAQDVEWQKEKAIAKHSSYVDYVFISKYFTTITQDIFTTFNKDKKTHEYAEFMHFCNNQETSDLENYSTYCALAVKHNSTSWLSWELAYQDKESQEVKTFKLNHKKDILYYKFLQWQAKIQLDNSIDTLAKNGLQDGLFLDLAIGTMTGGYSGWAFPELHIDNVSVGAPADEFSVEGQQWNLAPYNPLELNKNGYKPFASLLKNIMKYAQFLRLDHVIGLSRLFLLHQDLGLQHGIYLACPKDDLMNILCLESHRNKCVVVGEALGLVEEGFLAYLKSKNILSFTLMIFERWSQSRLFKRPDSYDKLSVSSTTNHDLPTMAGYYMGSDLAYERKLGLNTSYNITQKENQREEDRTMLISALADQHLAPTFHSHEHDNNMLDFTLKTQEYIAKSSSLIAMVNYHDLLSNYRPLNIPGTNKNYKNWSLKTDIDTKCAIRTITKLSHIMGKYNRNYK